MLDFNDIIDEILKTPPRSSPHLPPLPQPPPPTPFASSAPAGLVLAPLDRLSRPSCRPPVASPGDIWDVSSSDEEVKKEEEEEEVKKEEEEEVEKEEEEVKKEEKEEEDGDAPVGGLGYVIQYTNAVFNDYS